MKKIILFTLILSFFALFAPRESHGQEAINKFGIHILEPADLPRAQELVNSTGGDWGWVTVVIREDDLNPDKWQSFFDVCREKHLIPLVRLATKLEGNSWIKPKSEDSRKWADFLDSLNWPVSDQYVIIFNEPNHAKEWGGQINPKEYAQILSSYREELKKKNKNFKILNAGLDLAAPNGKETMEAFRYLQEMNWEVPGIFEALDGWSSHSYPNHGFLGKPWEKGKTSVMGYEWELAVLENTFGVKRELPVFITETGWPQRTSKNSRYYDLKTVAKNIKYAFENIWLRDTRVKAVTPFLLNYPDDLFTAFSWLDKEGNPCLQFEAVKLMPKVSWWPDQKEKLEVITVSLPPFLPAETNYKGQITLKNTGQSIWGERGEVIFLASSSGQLLISNLSLNENQRVRPGEKIVLPFSITSFQEPGEHTFSWGNLPEYKIKVYPPSLLAKTRYTFWDLITNKLKGLFK